MVRKLRGEHMGEQSWTGQAAIDGTTRCRRLHYLVVSRAAQLRTHVADHLEAGRNPFQNLGDIFAELLQRAAALRAGWFRRCVGPDLARQMLGKGTASLRGGSGVGRVRFRGGRRQRLDTMSFEVFELQFELLNLPLDLLRLSSELQAPQFGDQQLQMFNLMD